jgi:hypothetical protein
VLSCHHEQGKRPRTNQNREIVTFDAQAAQSVITELIPQDAPGAIGLRAVADAAIQRYVQATQDGASRRKQVFLPTSDGMLDRINDPAELEAFRTAYGLRTDWHEPDNNGITAYVIGDHLDNAMGPTVERGFGELNVVLVHEQTYNDVQGSVFLPIAVVNLATLLGWATDGARASQIDINAAIAAGEDEGA